MIRTIFGDLGRFEAKLCSTRGMIRMLRNVASRVGANRIEFTASQTLTRRASSRHALEFGSGSWCVCLGLPRAANLNGTLVARDYVPNEGSGQGSFSFPGCHWMAARMPVPPVAPSGPQWPPVPPSAPQCPN